MFDEGRERERETEESLRERSLGTWNESYWIKPPESLLCFCPPSYMRT